MANITFSHKHSYRHASSFGQILSISCALHLPSKLREAAIWTPFSISTSESLTNYQNMVHNIFDINNEDVIPDFFFSF